MEEKDELESLGEQLYPLVYDKHQQDAAKLTGMLLELPGAVLDQMLQDEALLCEALEKAARALRPAGDPGERTREDEDGGSTSSDSLGEQLFELVDARNSGHSHKITGMLLEQHKDTVLKLLSDSRLLDEQVELAMKTLEEQMAEETDASEASDGDAADQLGEELFVLVEEIDPRHAHDITGMLLEMDAGALRRLLGDRATLEAAVHKAQAALPAPGRATPPRS